MQLLRRLFRRKRLRAGDHDIADARRLADAERTNHAAPDGCAWLDARTIDDLDLPLVFRAIDRARTATGAQLLWRWLAAPAVRRDVLDARERNIALVTDSALRDHIDDALPEIAVPDAPLLPWLLWEPPQPPPPTRLPLAIVLAQLASLVFALWWTPALVITSLLFIAAMLIDDWSTLHTARHARALAVLAYTLDAGTKLVDLPAVLVGSAREDLVVHPMLRRRLSILTTNDPFGLCEILRAGFLIRLFTIRSCMRIVDRECERLRRLVLWIGELDAFGSVARLRAERDVHVPALVEGGTPTLHTRGVLHPAIEGAVGNDVALDATSLLVTGSNMSGKSTFLRTLAINAILAQSIHTTFGTWRGSLLRVRSVMRIGDDVAAGMSTYAVEVAAVGELFAAAGGLPSLFVLDEPFNGTNPTIRVPIVVAVLEHLAAHDLVVAATHDLDVAKQLGPNFERVYFAEPERGHFDRKLRAGIAPSANAIDLLRRAGYPDAILSRLGTDEVTSVA